MRRYPLCAKICVAVLARLARLIGQDAVGIALMEGVAAADGLRCS